VTGSIKFFDARKRYGIIIPNGVDVRDRDRHVFFYEDVLEGGKVAAGQEVEYSLLPNYPSPRALAVRVLGKVSYVPINQPTRKAAAHGD
jgi:cold shock CspA family protein